MRFYKFGFISLLVICFFLVSSSIAYAGVNLSTWTLDDTSGNDLLRFVYPSNNPAFVVNTNGNVGIGTTNPISTLHVKTTQSFYEAATSLNGLSLNPSASLQTITTNWNSGGQETPMSLGTWNNRLTQVYLATSGNVGIGTSSPHGGLHVRRSVVGGYAGTFQNTAGGAGDPGVQIYAGTSTSGTYIQFYPADGSVTQGSISQSGGNTLYNATSDIRLKEYITDTHVGLTDLMKISVKNYTMKSDPTHTVNTGFIAQELYEIYPNAVSVPKTPEQYWGVDYGKLTPLLVKSMQEQQKKIENQQKEIDSLNKEINEIKSLLKK